ncbi:MAG: hypothetical protein V1776_00895 [Candidatus Diapherotrites archaeon]
MGLFYAIREATPISTIPVELTRIHLVRPISTKKLGAILAHCPHLVEIGASPSVEKRLAPKAVELVKKHKIVLVRAHRAGRALNLDLETIRTISDLRKDFLSVRKISERVHVPKSTVHYLVKKSKREKIKKGKHVIYVQ